MPNKICKSKLKNEMDKQAQLINILHLQHLIMVTKVDCQMQLWIEKIQKSYNTEFNLQKVICWMILIPLFIQMSKRIIINMLLQLMETFKWKLLIFVIKITPLVMQSLTIWMLIYQKGFKLQHRKLIKNSEKN